MNAERPSAPAVASPMSPAAAAVLVFVVAASLQVARMPVGLAPMDAGDFATAAVGLGVPHSPGFPLQTMLSQAVSWLPLGTLAFRVGLLSALSTGGCAALGAWLAAGRGAGALAVLSAAMPIMLAQWSLAPLALAGRMPEVYALAHLLVLATALFCVLWSRCPSPRWWLLASASGTLAVWQHPLSALPVLLCVGVAVIRHRPPATLAGASAGAALAATQVVAYLPMATWSHPRHVWGNAGTWDGFLELVTGRIIRSAFDDTQGGSWVATGEYLAQLSQQVGVSMGWGAVLATAVLAGVGGVAQLRSSERTPLVLLAGLLLFDLWWALRVNSMGIRDAQTAGLALCCAAALVGSGVAWVSTRLAGWVGAGGAVGALAVILGLGFWQVRPSPMLDGFSEPSSLDDAVFMVHATAEPEFLATWLSDDLTSAATWQWVALDSRPDGLSMGRWLMDSPRSREVWLRSVVSDALEGVEFDRQVGEGRGLVSLLERNTGSRSVYWEVAGTITDLPGGVSWVLDWPAARVAGPGHRFEPGLLAYTDGVDAPVGALARAGDAWFYRRWLASQWGAQGVRAAGAGDLARAGAAFEHARTLAPWSASWLNNLAYVEASTGDVQAGLRLATQAWRLDRLSRSSWNNVVLYSRHLGQPIPADAQEWGLSMAWPDPAQR